MILNRFDSIRHRPAESRIGSRPSRSRLAIPVLAGALVAAACGSDTDTGAADGRPTIVVTTNILGDVVAEVVGDQADVVTIMPVGADPHDFQASAQEIDRLLSADALVVNGAGFEESLLDVIDNARDADVPTREAIEGVETIEFGGSVHDDEHENEGHDDDHTEDDHIEDEHSEDEEHGEEEHGEEEHGEEEHGDEEHDHGHEGVDPHFFTDPVRMATAVDGIVEFLLAEVDGLDGAALQASAAAYVEELSALDADVASLLDGIDTEQRVLVTNHEVFGYFADRYDFEVVGVVVPGGGTTDAASAGDLAELAEVVTAEGVPAIFADASSSDELINTLATEVGDVAVVELYSESLGDAASDGATYVDMVRTNAERISAALT